MTNPFNLERFVAAAGAGLRYRAKRAAGRPEAIAHPASAWLSNPPIRRRSPRRHPPPAPCQERGRSSRLLAVDHPRRGDLEDISRLLATGRCSTDDLERFGRQAHCFRHLGIVEELLSHIGIAGDDGSFDSRSIPIGTPV